MEPLLLSTRPTVSPIPYGPATWCKAMTVRAVLAFLLLRIIGRIAISHTYIKCPLLVSVLKLVTPVDTTVFPVVGLNTDCNAPSNCQTLQLYGFGRTSDGGSLSDVLKVLDSRYECLGSGSPYMNLYASPSSGVCQGDSGGPAVIGNTQYGIASFVQGGCAAGNPDGFARVSTYYTWIQQQVCTKSSDKTNFGCTRLGALRNAARDGLSSVFFGAQDTVQSMASMVGFGPKYSGDIEVFPMGHRDQ